MSRDLSRVPFARALIDAGFHRDGTSEDPLMYVLRVGERELDVQLWKDGAYRVSHGLVNELPGRPATLNGKCGTTPPTYFTTVNGMWAAIMKELSRTDHKPDGFTYRLGWGATTLIAAERRRQVEVEGWTAEHDDGHRRGELAAAAAHYALAARTASAAGERSYSGGQTLVGGGPLAWPWSPKWWNPGDVREMLVKAGALMVAEIERLDRARCRADDAEWAAKRVPPP